MPTRPVRIELHAQAADMAGCRHVEVDLGAGATGADAKRALGDRHPALGELLAVSALATDHEYVRDTARVGDVDSLHLVPPVSGG